jgi:hypothetical protein
VCTLDEYVAFLGEDATPEALIRPEDAFVENAPRIFPAPYYQRIRTYRAGAAVEGDASFPHTAADWDTLLTVYRSNVLSRTGPGK